MSTTLSDLEDAIFEWLETITGREIVRSDHDEGHLPKEPYCSFRINETKPLDHPVAVLSTDGLTETIEQMSEIKVKIVLLGGAASAVINRVIASMWAADRNVDLWAISGLGGFTNPLDLTSLETGAMRQRWETTLTLYTTLSEDFTGQFQEVFELSVVETDKGLIYEEDQPIDKLAGC